MLWIGIVLAVFILDLAVKETVEAADSASFPRELEGTHGKIMLYKNHNNGFAFGVLRERPELVKLVPLMVTSAVAGIFCYKCRKKGDMAEKLALSMVLGGALSNLYDRLLRNYVVDYFSVQWKQLKKVVFNLGDIFIFLGAGVMLLLEIVRAFREE